MKVDSWLTDEDAIRCWKVAQGELPESFATVDELEELARVMEEIVAEPKFKRNRVSMN